MKAYFAHPINTYNTVIEKVIVGAIKSCFHCEVENPNHPVHQRKYEETKKRIGDGMIYFFDVLCECDILVALPFRDDFFGAGVAWEMKVMFSLRRPVYEVNHKFNLLRLHALDPRRVLSINETQERVRNPVIRIRYK
jgi:hypothetical protein